MDPVDLTTLESAIAERIERLIPRWIRLGYELRVTEEAGEPLVVSIEDLIGYVAEDENFWS